MSNFTLKDYKELKKKGLMHWNTDLINSHAANMTDFINTLSSQSASKEGMTAQQFDENKSRFSEFKNNHQYMQTYVNSLKDSEGYDSAKKSFDSVNEMYSSAQSFFNSHKDGNEYITAVNEQKKKYANLALGYVTQGFAEKLKQGTYEEKYKNYSTEEVKNELEATTKEFDELYASPQHANEMERLNSLNSKIKNLQSLYKTKSAEQKSADDKVNKIELNKRYSQRYEGYNAEQLLGAASRTNDEYEKKWLKNRAVQFSSSDEMQKLYDKITGEIDELDTDENVYSPYEHKRNGTLKSISEYNKQRNYLKEQLPEKQRQEKLGAYFALVKNSDFEENSHEETDRIKSGADKLQDEAVPASAEERDDLDNRKYMSEKEQKVFNYLVNTQGDEAAQEFFETLKPDLNERMTAHESQKAADFADEHPVLGSIQSVGYNVLSGAGFVEDVFNTVTGNPIDTNSFFQLPAHLREAEQNAVAEKIDNPLGQWLYRAGMSAVESAVNIALAKGIGGVAGAFGASEGAVASLSTNATSVIMGSQVATQTVIESKEKGLSDGQAVTLGLIHGLVEHLTEKYSVEAILTDTGSVKRMLRNAFIAEGSEEVVANWADRIIDVIAEGDKNENLKKYNEYLSQGMSGPEAFFSVVVECLGEDVSAFMAGGLAGVAMSGTSQLFDKAKKKIAEHQKDKALRREYTKIAGNVAQDEEYDTIKRGLIEQAKNSDNPKAQKMAASFEKTINSHDGDMRYITDADVANIMKVIEGSDNQSGERDYANIARYAANTAEQRNMINAEFENDGTKKSGDSGNQTSVSAFGKAHPNGLSVIENKTGKEHVITRVESSSRDYETKDNVVVFKTKDGEYFTADEISISDGGLSELASYAKNFETMGARALLANYESYKEYATEQKNVSTDYEQYGKLFEKAYEWGRMGATYEQAVQHKVKTIKYIENMIGTRAVTAAINAGNNDVDVNMRHETNTFTKLKMPGKSHAADSRVIVDVSNKANLQITDEQKTMLDAIAQKTGRDIVLTDNISGNGEYRSDGRIYINAELENSDYMVATALHEATHGLREAAPTEYRALEKFIVNYLIEKGESIDRLLEDIKLRWGKSAGTLDLQMEELVCQTVMAIASNESAMKTAIECEKNKSLLEKVRDAIKKIADGVRSFIKGVMTGGKYQGAHNAQAQPWIDDIEALNALAQKLSNTLDSARENVQKYGQKINTRQGVRYAKNDINKSSVIDFKKNQDRDSIDYINSVDNNLLNLVNEVEKGNDKFKRLSLSDCSPRQIEDIKRITGQDFTGYKNSVNTSGIQHILNRHGKNGEHDHTMSNNNDIARIGYVINNYDNVDYLRDEKGNIVYSKAFSDKNNNPVPFIVYSKKLGNSIYVVQAVGENKFKKLWISSAYMSKKQESTVTQAPDAYTPRSTSENGLASPVLSNNSISQQDKNSNSKFAVDDTIYDFLTDEYGSPESTLDYKKIIEQNPNAAVAMIYRNTMDIAKKAMYSNGDIKISNGDCEKIAGNVLKDMGVNLTKHEASVKVFAEKIEHFAENIVNSAKIDKDVGKNIGTDYFRNQFEDLVRECSGYVALSEQFDLGKRKAVRNDIYNFIGDNVLVIRDFEFSLIQNEFGSMQAFRTRMFGKTKVGYERNGVSGYHIEDVVDYVKNKFPEIAYNKAVTENGGYFAWFDYIVNDYLSPKLERKIGSKDIKNYYEDEQSAGIEAAMHIVGEIINAQNRISGERDGGYGKTISQNTYSLKLAKLKIAELRQKKSLLIRERTAHSEYIQKSVRKEYEERLKKANTIKGIKRLVNQFRSMIMNPTDERFVPPKVARVDLYTAFEALGNAVVVRDGSKVAERMGEMITKLRMLKNSDSKYYIDNNVSIIEYIADDYETEFDEEFFKSTDELVSTLGGGKKISSRDLTWQEAEDIYNWMRTIEGKIISARKQILREENISNRESGERIIEQVNSVKVRSENFKKIISGVGEQFLNGIRAARMLSGYDDKAELMYHINTINEGQRKQWFWQMNAEKKFKDLTENNAKEYEKSLNEVVDVEYEGNDGNKHVLKITRMQGLQILMTWERETSSGNMIHMQTGGIVVANHKNVAKGSGRLRDGMQEVRNVNLRLIAAIDEKMGSFEKQYKKIAEQYFNEVSKKTINETMLALKHREIATSEYYIPVWVDSNYTTTEISSLKLDATIEGRGSYKSTVKSTLPIIITSLNSVIDSHIKDTAQLYGVAIPVRNFKRAFRINTKAAVGEGDNQLWFTSDSVKHALSKKFGDSSVKFFENLITDLETPRKSNESAIGKMLYHGNVGRALAANLSVVIKQAASYPTAGRYLSGKSLMAGLGVFSGKAATRKYNKVIAEIDEHTAQHYMRRIGLSTQEIADMMNSKLYKLPTIVNPIKWIQGVDCLTTAALWEAVKVEVNSNYKKSGKSIGSDEYWNEVTQLYDKVIEDTQPMYDSLHRAEIQKGAGSLRKSVFLFTTQPLQNTGILYDAAAEMATKKGADGSKKRFFKAVASQLSSLSVFAVMTLLSGIILHKTKRYKDDEDKITFQSVLPVILSDMFDNGIKVLMPYGGDYLEALIKDSYNAIVEGKPSYSNTLEAAQLSFINDLYTKLIKTENIVASEFRDIFIGKDFDIGKVLWNLFDTVGAFSQVGGVPYENFKNMVNSVISYSKDVLVNEGLTDNNTNLETSHMAQHIVSALKNGDKEKAQKYETLWKNDLKSSGKSEAQASKTIKGKIAQALADTDKDISDAAIARENGEFTNYRALVDKVVAYGFDVKDVESAVDKVISGIKSDLKERNITDVDEVKSELVAQEFNDEAAEKFAGEYVESLKEKEVKNSVFDDSSDGKAVIYKERDGFEALKNGDTEGYEEIRKYMIEHGNTYENEKDFDKKMTNANYTDDLWKAYIEANDNGNSEEKAKLKKQLTNVYGTWEKAVKALHKYQKKTGK